METKKGLSVEAWRIRIFKQDFCGILSYENNEPTKCHYCLVHNPYHCCFKVKADHFLWERLFDGGRKE